MGFLPLNIRGLKFSEIFLKSFYRSKLVFHLEFYGMFIKYIFHKIQKCPPQIGFNVEKNQ